MIVFRIFNKKRKVIVSEENSGLRKREPLEYHESFLILVNRNSIIMVSKGYHYVINLGISNFYISIDPVYLGSMPKEPS